MKMNLTLDCPMIKATIGTVNFAACGNYRPQFTKITKIWQDRSPIRKSSIMLRSRKTLFNLLHPLLFNPVPQNFLYGLCGWRFLRWRQLAHAISCFRALHHRWHFASSSSWIWILFIKFSLDGPESEDGWPLIHKKIKKKLNTNKNATMIRTPANFFRKCDKFAKDSGIYKEREGLEYWNTAKERRNLHSFDMKSPHRAAIFFLRVSWIVSPKWARVAYFPRKDSLKINRSVKTPWHRPSMGVEGSKWWALAGVFYKLLAFW